MMKKRLYGLVVLVGVFGVGIVLFLYGLSAPKTQSRNGFTRWFVNMPLIRVGQLIEVQYNSWYIAGLTENRVYLGNYVQPEQVFSLNFNRSKDVRLQIQFTGQQRIGWKALKIKIDSPLVWAWEGVSPLIFIGALPGAYLKPKLTPGFRFNACLPISQNSFIFRVYDETLKQNVLRNINYKTINWDRFKLEKQQEGVFSTDGIIIYNKVLKQLIYVYYYRNRYQIIDTLLSLKEFGNTIDTISRANIKIGEIKSENMVKLLNRPLVVNKQACTFGTLLFIHSGLKADNERLLDFYNNAVIDVYDLKEVKYLYSFYLPNIDEKAFTDFAVVNDILVALYDHQLGLFHLPEKNYELTRH